MNSSVVVQQKIPVNGVIDQLNETHLATIISNLNKYIRDGWSIPHTESSRGMPTSEFIKIIWNVINKTHSTNYSEILREIHRWMPTRPLLQYKSITNDGIEATDLGINISAPINRHINSFNSVNFSTIHNNILEMFAKFNSNIKKGSYYIIDNTIVFVVNDEKPSWDKTNTIEKLYNLIIYNKKHIIGSVCEDGPQNITDHSKSYICVEEVDGNTHLTKCYQTNSSKRDTPYMVASVRLLNKDINNNFYLENTKIAITNDNSDEYVVINASEKVFNSSHNIYYLANGYPILESVVKTVEFPKFFKINENNPLAIPGNINRDFDIDTFINKINVLFVDNKKL